MYSGSNVPCLEATYPSKRRHILVGTGEQPQLEQGCQGSTGHAATEASNQEPLSQGT
jgi:hypothetical protein